MAADDRNPISDMGPGSESGPGAASEEAGDGVVPPRRIEPGKSQDKEVAGKGRAALRRKLIAFVALLVLALLLTGVWRFTALGDWLSTERLTGLLDVFEDPWVRNLALIGAIIAASLLMVPLAVLVVVAAVLAGPWIGFFCSMGGALVSGAMAFGVGQWLGGAFIQKHAGERLQRLSQQLSQCGVLAVAVLRVIPVAPYSVVNLVAGASHLSLTKFLLGSAIGLFPGFAGLTLFSESLVRFIKEPNWSTLVILAVVIVALVFFVVILRRAIGRRQNAEAS